MFSVQVCLVFLAVAVAGRETNAVSPPSVPEWPMQFTVQLTIYVEEYGSNWRSKGVMYYDYTQKVQILPC